ncbi:hypothetical protein PspLS_08182 [Pyricularia sp. CBS 133598]|nr:hypothetical protein PspLS_08182 [Pyricularia sp. CBS 133598]
MTLRIPDPTKSKRRRAPKEILRHYKTCSAGGPLSEPAAPTLSLPFDENGCAQRPFSPGLVDQRVGGVSALALTRVWKRRQQPVSKTRQRSPGSGLLAERRADPPCGTPLPSGASLFCAG